MERTPTPLETVVELLILVAIATQAWILVDQATEGGAGRWVGYWWRTKLRPQVVRVVAWFDAAALVDRMVSDEIAPYLERS